MQKIQQNYAKAKASRASTLSVHLGNTGYRRKKNQIPGFYRWFLPPLRSKGFRLIVTQKGGSMGEGPLVN